MFFLNTLTKDIYMKNKQRIIYKFSVRNEEKKTKTSFQKEIRISQQ